MSADYSQMYPEILGKEKKIKKILVKEYGYKKENIHLVLKIRANIKIPADIT